MAEREAVDRKNIGYAAYAFVWILLAGLTWLTVTISSVETGALKTVGPLIIASLKAILVLGFFMHLKYERGLVRYIILTALGVFVVLGWFVFADVAYR